MKRLCSMLLAALAASACGSVTEIVVEVDTDLEISTTVDSLRVTADVAGGAPRTSTASLGAGQPPPPRTVVLLYRGGALGPVNIEAEALLGAGVVVSARRRVSFEPGRSLRVRIPLEAACVGVSCAAPLTCAGGTCRASEVSACELAGSCADAGASDAASDASAGDAASADAGPRDGGPVDAPLTCALTSGICGVAETLLPGDTIALTPCTAAAPGVTIAWSTVLPGGATSTDARFVARDLGEYVVTATASAPSGCTGTTTVRIVSFGTLPIAGRTPVLRRDLAARLDLGFVATDDGPWAVDRTGWHDLRVGATGTVVNRDLAAVVVRGTAALFGARTRQTVMTRAVVAGDLSAIALTDVALPTGDRSIRALAVPMANGESGAGEPAVAATHDGWVIVEGAPLELTARAVGPTWDVAAAAAFEPATPATRGELWGLTTTSVRNFALGAGAAFNAGALTALTPATGLARTMAIDAREPALARLWLCSEDHGVAMVELTGDWSARTAWPAASASLTTVSCRDLDLDPRDGSAWVATASGLVRVGTDGSVSAMVGRSSGATDAGIARVALAFDATRRQVWALDDLGEVYLADAMR